MNWGSVWEFTDYTSQNWWNLYLEDANAGGVSHTATAPKPERKKEPNPLLRVRPPQSISVPSIDQTSESLPRNLLEGEQESELVYATETFDRQQPAKREVDSRWLRNQRELHVPTLDDQLAVAFQKFLRDEEHEFMLLILASEDDGVRDYV